MMTMLIFEAVLLLGVTSYASTSANSIIRSRSQRDLITPAGSIVWSTQPTAPEGKLVTIPYSSALTLPGELLQAGTTVHTIPALDATPGPTYIPYQRQGSNGLGSELRHRKNFPTPNLQSGFQASNLQTLPNHVPQNNYRNNPSSYLPQASYHFQNKPPNKGNEKSQYFQSPSSYRLSSQPSKAKLRSGLFPVTGGSLPSFSKFKSPSTISGPNSGDHSLETPGKYRSNSGSSFNPHPTHHSSKRPNSSSHKHGSYPISKNVDVPPVSLQTSSEAVGFVREFENEPVLLSSGLDYQAHPSSSGFKYDHSKSHSTPSSTGAKSFNSNPGHYQPRVLPIHSSRSTPQIPQYQAASVNEYPSQQYNKPQDGYEQLINQPQLHFTTGAPGLSVDNTHPIVYHTNPFEQIRTDVELINKKKTTTPSPFESDEHDFDEAFKTNERDFSYLSAGTDNSNQHSSKSPTRDTNFELPSSNLFSSYDEAFGKYSKLASLEQENTEKRAPHKVDDTSKPVYQSIEEDNSDHDGDKSPGEYRSSYTEGKDTNDSDEDEEEEESRRSEQHGTSDEKEARDDHYDGDEEESSPYKNYGKDFEKEFEESYRQDLPKDDYVHVKEVPEVEEPRSESKKQLTKRPSTRSSRGGSKQKTRYSIRGNYDKPKKFESQTTEEYESPKSNYRDNEGHGTRTSLKSSKINDPQIKDIYGYKIPRDRGTARFTKKVEKPTTEAERSMKKLIHNSEDHSEEAARFFSTTQTPLTSTVLSIEDLQSYTFPPFDSWKPGNKLAKGQDSYEASRQEVRAIFNPQTAASSFPQGHQGPLMYLANGQIVRDLSGI